MPNLDEIKARRGRITAGGWRTEFGEAVKIRAKRGGYVAILGWLKGPYGSMGRISNNEGEANAHFIANASTDIDWLIAEVERMREENDWLEKIRWMHNEDAQFMLDEISRVSQEVKSLKAEKAQAEVERDALAAELEENWPFLGGVMYAAAEMVTNGMDTTIPLDILMASGHWDEFEAHCNSYDVERFRQAVGEKCVNRLRLGQRTQQQAEKKGA